MPEAGKPFELKLSTQASEIWRALPDAARLASMDVADEIARDPERVSQASRRLIEGEEVFVYSHPDPPLELTFKLDRVARMVHLLHMALPAVEARHVLFLSYAREDSEWRNELWKWLEPLREGHRVRKIWDDQQIRAGQLWKEEIHQALAESTAAVLLVSQDFFDSEFVKNDELPRLLEAARRRELKLLWIAVSPSTWRDSALEQRQALRDPSDPLDALDDPARRQAFCDIYESLKQALATP